MKKLFGVMFSIMVLSLMGSGCSSDSKSDPVDTVQQDTESPADTAQDVQTTDLAQDVPNVGDTADVQVPEEVATDNQVPVDVVTDTQVPEDTTETAQPDVVEDVVPGVTGTITVKVGEVTTPVDLSKLDPTVFNEVPAIRLTRIVEAAAIAMPYNYHYNFIAGDGFNVLVDKMEGDYSKLPWYNELDKGFVYYDAEKDMLRIGWDAALAFPGSLNVKGIGDGTIEAVAVEATKFVVIAGTVRTLLDTATLPTVDVVDYKHPEDGAKPMIAMAEVFTAAGVTAPADFTFKFYGMDGFSNNDDNLMPYENAQHGYYEPIKRRIILEEAWDTNECCWSVKDTVLILCLPK